MDEALTQLIANRINSRTKLELMLYFAQNPYAVESAAGVARRLHRAAPALQPALQELAQAELLKAATTSERRQRTLFSFSRGGPHNGVVGELVAALATPQRSELLALVSESDAEYQYKKLQELRRLDSLRNRFVSMISHELRTPVSVIRGVLTTLDAQDTLPPERRRDLLAAATRQCDDLIGMIEDILTASGLQSGEPLRLDLHETALSELARRVVERARQESTAHELSLAATSYLPRVMADEQRIEQVLEDLLDNAVKFSPRGGPITVLLERAVEDIVLTVDDEGIGLSKAEIERVFERFYQAETDSTRLTGGCGLGLYLARRTVEQHGGRIWIEPKATAGLRVKLALPIAGPAPSPLPGPHAVA